MFRARASLHQRVYTHRKAKAVEYMVVDALLAAEPALRLAERARDVETFVTLDDTVLRQVETWWSTRRRKGKGSSGGVAVGVNDDDDFDDDDDDVAAAVAESQKILRRLRTRDLYRFCDEFVVPAAEAATFSLPTPEEVACCVPAAASSLLPADCRGKLDPRRRHRLRDPDRPDRGGLQPARPRVLLPPRRLHDQVPDEKGGRLVDAARRLRREEGEGLLQEDRRPGRGRRRLGRLRLVAREEVWEQGREQHAPEGGGGGGRCRCRRWGRAVERGRGDCRSPCGERRGRRWRWRWEVVKVAEGVVLLVQESAAGAS